MEHLRTTWWVRAVIDGRPYVAVCNSREEAGEKAWEIALQYGVSVLYGGGDEIYRLTPCPKPRTRSERKDD